MQKYNIHVVEIISKPKAFSGKVTAYPPFKIMSCEKEVCRQSKAGILLGEFVRANKQKANVIGW